MTTYKGSTTPVTRQPVPEDQRLVVVEKLFGIYFASRLEPVTYGQAEKMTESVYSGGCWQFYALDNSGPLKATRSTKFAVITPTSVNCLRMPWEWWPA